MLQGKIDILVLTESKLDSSFPINLFFIECYSKPFRFDRNRNRGGVLLYIREDIPWKELKLHRHPHDIEVIFAEVNLKKIKLLPFATYNQPSQVDEYFFGEIGKILSKYSQKYSKFLLIGDFNAKESKPVLAQFLHDYNAVNIIHENTCYKNMNNPSCIDLIITNSLNSFQNTSTFCIGLSDFHKLEVTALKTFFRKMASK